MSPNTPIEDLFDSYDETEERSDENTTQVFCDWGCGDAEGFCVIDTTGCYLLRCPLVLSREG